MPYLWEKNIDTYLISGVWLETNSVAFYCVRPFLNPGIGEGEKLTIDQVIKLIDEGFKVYTLQWDYGLGKFKGKDRVFHKSSENGKYLYIEPFDRKTKNLRHLINADWFKLP